MRFLLAALFSLLLVTAAHAQDAVAPTMDEYNDVKPGLLMPGATAQQAPQAQDDSGLPTTVSQESQQVMTISDIVAVYKQGKYEQAATLLEPLAKNGQHQAEELLGIMYRLGQGVAKDPAKAMDLLSRAAEANRPLAQHHIGSMYYGGEGVSSDPVKALMWLYIAIVHYPDGAEKDRARADRDAIYAQLSRRDKERAREMARGWLEKKDEAHLLDMAEQ